MFPQRCSGSGSSLQSTTSSEKKVPVPFSKRPITGGPTGPSGERSSSHQMAHCPVLGSNERSATPRRGPAAVNTLSSTFASPPMMGRSSLVPSNSTHSCPPSGSFFSVRWCTRHDPTSKSKSWAPGVLALGAVADRDDEHHDGDCTGEEHRIPFDAPFLPVTSGPVTRPVRWERTRPGPGGPD